MKLSSGSKVGGLVGVSRNPRILSWFVFRRLILPPAFWGTYPPFEKSPPPHIYAPLWLLLSDFGHPFRDFLCLAPLVAG